ncbi:hypothetical protein QF037_002708 [Streptomyces canus]|nr:hypothetical protein [Streptomyces canus]
MPQHHAVHRNPLSAERAWVSGAAAAQQGSAGHLLEA